MQTSTPSVRRVTGVKPTGHLQLGNLLAAIRPMVAGQYDVQTAAGSAAALRRADHGPRRSATEDGRWRRRTGDCRRCLRARPARRRTPQDPARGHG